MTDTGQRVHVNAIQARLDNHQAVIEALATAGEPLTRREIQLEALISSGGAQTALRELEERGQVKQVEDPDDGRVPEYCLSSMCFERPRVIR